MFQRKLNTVTVRTQSQAHCPLYTSLIINKYNNEEKNKS